MSSYVADRKNEVALKAFFYEEDDRVFRIGSQTLELNQDLLNTRIASIVLSPPETYDLDTAPVCLNLHEVPIGSRSFHNWLGNISINKNKLAQTAHSTTAVMESVLTALDPMKIPKVSRPGHVSFNFNVDEDNHIKLHTFGDCACLGPFPEGHWVTYSDWEEEGLCEYTFHNVWAETQKWSLLAGLGHLARLAVESSD